jgi:hypothetical protein
MYIGQKVVVRVDGIVEEGIVTEIRTDDIVVKCGTKEVTRKIWEVNKVK